MKFSERYGYVKPVEVLKRGCINEEDLKAICNCFDLLYKWLNDYDMNRNNQYGDTYTYMEEKIWCFFLNERRGEFYYGYNNHKIAATKYLLSKNVAWYLKFDMIEFAIAVLRQKCERENQLIYNIDAFVNILNATFCRLNYAYRVVDDQIVEITDDDEIKTIEEALKQTSSVQTHLSGALKHLSNRPTPDYRNSIKESISAVEAICREITSENTLGDALKKLEKNGVKIPVTLKSGIEKLYIYTNNDKTGIRHALMDDDDAPGYDEAKFMLVACSAFVNYVQGKRGNLRFCHGVK